MGIAYIVSRQILHLNFSARYQIAAMAWSNTAINISVAISRPVIVVLTSIGVSAYPFAQGPAMCRQIQFHRIRRPVLVVEKSITRHLESELLVEWRQIRDAIDVALENIEPHAVLYQHRNQLQRGITETLLLFYHEFRANCGTLRMTARQVHAVQLREHSQGSFSGHIATQRSNRLSARGCNERVPEVIERISYYLLGMIRVWRRSPQLLAIYRVPQLHGFMQHLVIAAEQDLDLRT